VHPTQPVEIFYNFYAVLYRSHRLTAKQNVTEIVPGKPLRLGLNARGLAKYGDIKGYIFSETVQDTAMGTIND